MDYLQYIKKRDQKMKKITVLNLIINGLPSILLDFATLPMFVY